MAAFQPALASPERPTGPAATDAPAPTLKWPDISWSMPSWFMTIITRSLLWPPICQPMLPPEISNGAGALHPELVWQVARPLPCSPPTMNAPLIMCGITAMHLAPRKTASGMPGIACGHLLHDLGCLIHFRCCCIVFLRPAHRDCQGQNA